MDDTTGLPHPSDAAARVATVCLYPADSFTRRGSVETPKAAPRILLFDGHYLSEPGGFLLPETESRGEKMIRRLDVIQWVAIHAGIGYV
jgi:hypothetical protein